MSPKGDIQPPPAFRCAVSSTAYWQDPQWRILCVRSVYVFVGFFYEVVNSNSELNRSKNRCYIVRSPTAIATGSAATNYTALACVSFGFIVYVLIASV